MVIILFTCLHLYIFDNGLSRKVNTRRLLRIPINWLSLPYDALEVGIITFILNDWWQSILIISL